MFPLPAMKKAISFLLAVIILASFSTASDFSGLWGNYHYYGSFQKEPGYTRYYENSPHYDDYNGSYRSNKRIYTYRSDIKNEKSKAMYYGYNYQQKTAKIGYSKMYYWLFDDYTS